MISKTHFSWRQRGFRDWRETNIDYRAEKLRDIGKALRARSEEMAQMITSEMGKPINQARAEVAKSAKICVTGMQNMVRQC